ncbi:MAG TPA: DUF429 domain-containing protein [Caldimonas sp.]|jgi:hypothetical protein|nr:DUF429 domain-containing protein [Caldimonas sp.]HEX2540014.1 DUF429 domain-containing protein [Caldimonas sp.]
MAAAPARLDEHLLAGVDFTCNPSRRKPVTVATGRVDGNRLRLEAIESLTSLAEFEHWLQAPGPWLGAFDFPFGLPRVFVDSNGLGGTCAEVMAAVRARCPDRMAWRAYIDAWGNARPKGTRLPHRVSDRASTVLPTSALQTRYVPVGLMYYEGIQRLLASGVSIAGLHAGDPERIAVEAYPRRLAHSLIEWRSYKNDDRPERTAAREAILRALEESTGTGSPALAIEDPGLRASLVVEASGDRLDAVLCLVQAARSSRLPNYGMPDAVDPVEGWIPNT